MGFNMAEIFCSLNNKNNNVSGWVGAWGDVCPCMIGYWADVRPWLTGIDQSFI